MTTNIAESFNRVLKGVRSLPLCAIIDLTFYRTAEYFRDSGNQAEECTTRFAPRVHKLLDARRAKAQHHRTRIYIGAITSLRYCANAGMPQRIAPETPCNSVSLALRKLSALAT